MVETARRNASLAGKAVKVLYASDVPLSIDVDPLRSRHFGQRGHAHERATERNDEPGSVGDLEIAHMNFEVSRSSEACGIVGE